MVRMTNSQSPITEIDFDDFIAVVPSTDVAKQQEPRPESRVEARYGVAGKAGWSPVPDVLLFNQHKLKITGDDLIVLLNLMAHYYVKDEMPFIRPTTIAKRMGVSQRKVQRSIARLRKKGLILKGKHKDNGQIIHDLTPLIDQLQPFGEERIATRTAWQSQRSSTG
ncbi:helix-turn-helix domain-containing protein [Bradyrhizobium sp. 177]|nr:helix-turn-helix domain-containing protein [Bradyrhizobium sp. 177]